MVFKFNIDVLMQTEILKRLIIGYLLKIHICFKASGLVCKTSLPPSNSLNFYHSCSAQQYANKSFISIG